MSLRIAFCGTGYINQIHARAARALPDVALSAVVNHRVESMSRFADEFQIAGQYATLTDLIEDGGADAVIVGTPNYLHAEQTIAALNAGLDVMVEKPMALNSAEAEAMWAASQKTGKLLMVAHCWRFDPEIQWLRRQADSGELGPIVRTKGISAHVGWGPGGWFADKSFAGAGAMADLGVHAIDTVRYLLGDPEPVSVYACIGTHYRPLPVDDTGVLLVTWANGTVSYIETGWYQPHADGQESFTQLYGTKAFGQVFPTYLEVPPHDGVEAQRLDSPFPPVRPFICPQSMYDAQMAHFVECIRNGRTPVPGGREGWTNMRIVDAAYASAHTGQAVNLESYL